MATNLIVDYFNMLGIPYNQNNYLWNPYVPTFLLPLYPYSQITGMMQLICETNSVNVSNIVACALK